MQFRLRSAVTTSDNVENHKTFATLMHKHASSMTSQAFGDHSAAGLIVAYQSQQDALRFLSSVLGQSSAVAVLLGPTGSGKSTIINEQQSWSSRDAHVASFEGAQLTPRQLLTGMLSQFDIQYAEQHEEQLLQMLNGFLTQQTKSGAAPILIVDNADRMTPSAFRLLNWLAALEQGGKFALRIALSGKEPLRKLLQDDGMRNIARRHPATYSLNPMTTQETMIYLRTRLIAVGGERAEKVFSIDVCEKLHELSSGWLGLLNKCAIDYMEHLESSRPVKPMPRITLSRDGQSVAEFELTERQYIIGRTELADIVIDDNFVSKIHALLQIYSNAIILIDLNSTNGTTVNSRMVQKAILRSDDIISLGRYRLKIENAPAIDAEMDERIKASDTMTMQNLVDMRRARAKRTIKALNR